jgi:Tol biopolymer transport system component
MAKHKATTTRQATGSAMGDTAAAAIGLLTVAHSDPGEAHLVGAVAAGKNPRWPADADDGLTDRRTNTHTAVQPSGADHNLTDAPSVTGKSVSAKVSGAVEPEDDQTPTQAGTAFGTDGHADTLQLAAPGMDGDAAIERLADQGDPAPDPDVANPEGSGGHVLAFHYNAGSNFASQVDDGNGDPATALLLASDPQNHAPVLPPAPTMTLVSTDAAGHQGNSASFDPVFSPDGTKVAFASYAADLVPGDTNLAEDIFVKDLLTGEITRIAAGEHPVFSPDGTKIAFASLTSDLVPGDTNGTYDIFVKDLVTGALIRASSDASGNGANNYSYDPVFSPDGTKVAYYSGASNLVPGDTNNVYDVFVKDLVTGEVTLITTNSVGDLGNEESFSLEFSPDGSKIVFASLASNMTPGDTNDKLDIFVKDLATGAVTLVSSDAAGGPANDHSEHPLWSPDGTKVAFVSDASNLVPGDTNGSLDIFIKDLASGAITRVSTDAAGNQGDGDSGGAVFSQDGTKLAFWSLAGNLVPNDTNFNYDVFIKDLLTGGITRVSEIDGLQGNSMSLNPAFAPDGQSIAFYSYSNNLAPDDGNSNHDIFVKTLPPSIVFSSIPADPAANDGQSVASLLGSKVTDADPDALLGIAVTGADTTHGSWQYSLDGGGSWLSFGAVSDTAATLLGESARIRFQPDPQWNGLADLTIRAWDQTDGHLSGDTGVDVSLNGGSTAYSATAADVNITVTPATHTTLDLLASTTPEGAAIGFADLFDDSLPIGVTARSDHAADFTGTIAGLDDTGSLALGDILGEDAGITDTVGSHAGIERLEITDGAHNADHEAASLQVADDGGTGAMVAYTHIEPHQEQIATV